MVDYLGQRTLVKQNRPFSRLRMLVNTRVYGLDLLAGYVMLLFMLPNDLYSLTSVYTFTTPSNIVYKWNDFYVSLLYMPVIAGGLYCFLAKRGSMGPNIFAFLLVMLAKDIVLAASGNDYVFTNKSFEQYFLWFTSACMACILFAEADARGSFGPILISMFVITALMLVAAIVLHVSPDKYDYVNRYTSTNMAHGETSLLLASFTMLILKAKDVEYKAGLIAVTVVLVVATGTRKDLLFMAVFFIIYLVNKFFVARNDAASKPLVVHRAWLISLLFLVLSMGVTAIALFPDKIFGAFNLERVTGLLGSIFSEGDLLSTDYSVLGREESLVAGLSVVAENPLLGQGFSFYAQQLAIQGYGFPTFPHFFWLFNWAIMGVLVLVPIIQFAYSSLVLIRRHDNWAYLAGYLILCCAVSGGEWSSFKIVLYLMVLYGIVVLRARAYRESGRLPHWISR